jgi:hypothetical protein
MAELADLLKLAQEMQQHLQGLKAKCDEFANTAPGVAMSQGDRNSLFLANASLGAALDEASPHATRLVSACKPATRVPPKKAKEPRHE